MFRQETPHWKVKKIDASEQRAKGFCPLTPNEVGVFLSALGYPRSTQIYIAAGEIYGGSERMAGFLQHFPNMLSKVCNVALRSPFHAQKMSWKLIHCGALQFLTAFNQIKLSVRDRNLSKVRMINPGTDVVISETGNNSNA